MKRKIITIDEKKCNGCGECASACHEGAIQIINGKARLVNEFFCDGLGVCIGTCGQGAITIEERDAEPYDEEKARALHNWPIQLQLINPLAPYFKNADVVIAADCAPFAYADFHNRFPKGRVLIILCPKLDRTIEAYVEKLAELFKNNEIQSLTLVHMEVPCCFGLVKIAEEAIRKSGKHIMAKEYTVSLKGEII